MANLGTALTHAYGGTGVSSRTQAFLMAVPVGSTLVGAVMWESTDNSVPTTITITDTAGNTYTVDASITSSSTVAVAAFRGRVSSALTTGDSLTVTISDTRIRWNINVDAFDDVLQALATSPLDKSATNASGTSASATSGTTDVTSQDRVLSYAAIGTVAGRTYSGVPGDWVQKATVQTSAGSYDRALKCLYRYGTLTAAQGVTVTVDPASASGGVVVVYKIASGRNNYARTEHRAEGLPDGTVLTTANSGGAAGTSYDLVSNSPKVDTSTAAGGTRSMLLAATAMSQVGGRDTDVSLGIARRVRGRGYFRFPTLPPANLGPIQTISNTVLACRVQFTTSGTLRIVDSNFTQMASSSTPVPLNQWVRMEWRLVASTTAGQASLDVWFDPHSTGAPDISMSSAASFNTLGFFDKYDSMLSFSSGQTYTMSVDEVVWTLDDTSVGPFQATRSYNIDFEAADPLGTFDATGNAALNAAAAHDGTQGLRLDSRTLPAYAKLSTLTFGHGHRWASIAAWMRLPLGSLTANCPLVRFRNTDPSDADAGGHGDVWIDSASGQVKADLMPANAISGSADMDSLWFYLQAVCGFKDDGTSVLKVKVNGAEIGIANSTLPVTGEALSAVVLGTQSVADAVLDVDELVLTVSDNELDYVGDGGPPLGCYTLSGGAWVPATPYKLKGGVWVAAEANVRSGGSWQALP